MPPVSRSGAIATMRDGSVSRVPVYYPEGVLAEEREAERALALADLGRTAEARLAAAAFLRKYPASPLGVRLRHRIPGIDIADASR